MNKIVDVPKNCVKLKSITLNNNLIFTILKRKKTIILKLKFVLEFRMKSYFVILLSNAFSAHLFVHVSVCVEKKNGEENRCAFLFNVMCGLQRNRSHIPFRM